MLRSVFRGPVPEVIASAFLLVIVGFLVAGCGSSAPTEAPTTAGQPSATAGRPTNNAPAPSGAPGESGGVPSGAVPPGVPSSVPGAAGTPVPTATEVAPTEAPKCVVFVSGPPAGEVGPATVHLRSTTPRTAVTITVRSSAATQQLSTETDGSGLAVQTVEPLAPGDRAQVAVAVGAARCATTFPPS